MVLHLLGLKWCAVSTYVRTYHSVFTKMTMAANQIQVAIHSALVKAVKEVTKAHEFGKDAWLNFVYDKSPVNDRYQTPTKDPVKYDSRFLGEFLEHAGRLCVDTDSIREFTARKCPKVDRPLHTAADFSQNEEMLVETLWIVAGDHVLHGASNLACQCREVASPSELVHHSGAAIAMLLGSIDAGSLAQKLHIQLAPTFKFGCVHFEGKFSQLPKNPTQAAWKDRFDNLNNCIRAFGVDARATRQAMGTAVRSNLHPRLQHFVGIGVGGTGDIMPCFHLDPDKWTQNLAQRKTNVLHDGLLVKEIWSAAKGHANGITVWHANRGTCVMTDLLEWFCQDLSTTLVVVLSPNGVLLTPRACERRKPCQIYFELIPAASNPYVEA